MRLEIGQEPGYLVCPSKSSAWSQKPKNRLDLSRAVGNNAPHIRPLAVRPLHYSEGEPNPWGFLFFGVSVFSFCDGRAA